MSSIFFQDQLCIQYLGQYFNRKRLSNKETTQSCSTVYNKLLSITLFHCCWVFSPLYLCLKIYFRWTDECASMPLSTHRAWPQHVKLHKENSCYKQALDISVFWNSHGLHVKKYSIRLVLCPSMCIIGSLCAPHMHGQRSHYLHGNNNRLWEGVHGNPVCLVKWMSVAHIL